MAVTEELRRRDTTPGATLQMVVLAVGDAGCIALDVASGAFVRPRWPVAGSFDPSICDLVRTGSLRSRSRRRTARPGATSSPGARPGVLVAKAASAAVALGSERAGTSQAPALPVSSKEALGDLFPAEEEVLGERPRQVLEPLQLVLGVVSADQEEILDPSRPEAVLLEGPPEVQRGRHTRLVRKVLRDAVSPSGQALLGFPAPARAFWDLDGSRGSLAIVEVRGGPVLLRRPSEDGLVRARFSWGGAFHELPVLDPALVAASHGTRRSELSGGSLHKRLGWWPRYLVVALTGPRDGYCYRVVASALPFP